MAAFPAAPPALSIAVCQVLLESERLLKVGHQHMESFWLSRAAFDFH